MLNNNATVITLGDTSFNMSNSPEHACEENKFADRSARILANNNGGHFLSLIGEPIRSANGSYIAQAQIQFCPFCGTKLS